MYSPLLTNVKEIDDRSFALIEKKTGGIKDDILSGLTVVLASVPEAVAFVFIAGGSTIVGFYGTFLLELVPLIIGGRPGVISGATGVFSRPALSLFPRGSWVSKSLFFPSSVFFFAIV